MLTCLCYVVAHKIYGVPQTINTANYVYFLAYQALFDLRHGVGLTLDEQDKDRLIDCRELDRLVTCTSLPPSRY